MCFYVMLVGCGLVEYKLVDIVEYFKSVINCFFEKCFVEFFNFN